MHSLHKSGDEKIYEAYKWVQEHWHEFNKEVCVPVLLEVHVLTNSCCCGFWDCLLSLLNCRVKYKVNVSNSIHASYLDGQVAHYTWKVILDILLKLWSVFSCSKPLLPNFVHNSNVKNILALYVYILKIFCG